MIRRLILGVVAIGIMNIMKAQSLDVDRILEPPSFSFGGSFNTQFQYQRSATEDVSEPFTYLTSLSLNFGVYDFSLPVNLSYSNRDYGVNNPFDFNFVQFSPKYKWFSGNFGQINESFTAYTLSGHQMQGGSVSIAHESVWPFTVVYGRLLRATEGDTIQGISAGYDRWGYGMKTEGKIGESSLSVAYFGAYDDEKSIGLDTINPLENHSLDIGFNTQVLEMLTINFNWASSIILHKHQATDTGESWVVSRITDRSYEFYQALKVGLQYAFSGSSIGINYERVDPNYHSLGGYNFVNDYQDIQLTFATTLFEKVNISGNGGYRFTDLENVQSKFEVNYIYGFQIAWNPDDKWSINTSYNNSQSFQNVRSQFVNVNDAPDQFSLADTTDVQLVSQNINSTISYVMEQTETRQQNISLNTSLQGNSQTEAESNYTLNVTSSYVLGFPKSGWNYTSTVMFTQQKGESESTTWGPNIGVQKTWIENLSSSLNLSYNSSSSGNGNSNQNLNLNVNSSYTIDSHAFNVSLSESLAWVSGKTTERMNMNFTYTYSF
ncbi:MAG: hypothetical protein OIF50_07225 [Flavobacteriaceae bacterium]|nr:hypothetical protein [Flavobacteriaceae bacterium]